VTGRDECELFAQAKAGNRGAFNRLHVGLEPSVRRFVRRLIGPSSSEPDVVQMTFLALYGHIGNVRSAEHLRPYLYRIARNLCYEELRQRGRFAPVSLEAARDDSRGSGTATFLVDTRELPDAVAHWVTLYGEVLTAMERLPELQRQALILYLEEHFTYSQIAEAMGTTVSAVKLRIHHGRRSLLRLLKPELLEEIGIRRQRT